MKKTLIGLLLILGIIAVGCNQPTVEEANEAFCQSLQAFGDALTNLETISPTSTVGDLKDASAEVDKAWNQVTKSAKQLNEVKLDTIDESWKNLRRTVNQVNDNDTLAAAAANIGVDVKEIRLSYDQIGQVNCPGMANLPMNEEPTNDTQQSAAPATTEASPAATEAAPPGFPGTYGTNLTLAGSQTDMVMVLNEDSSVFFVIRPTDQTTETIVFGQWQDNGDGTASIALTEMQDGQTLATPENFSFRLEGTDLVAFQFDETVYGADGFSMQRIADSAVATEAAAVAQQAGAAITTTAPLTSAVPLTSTMPVTATENTALPTDLFNVPPAPVASDASAVPEASAESQLPASPLDRTWQLQQITQTSGVNYTPGDPTLYTVTFRADGTLGVVADCNSGVGTYQASESGALTINLAISHAFCASNSLSNQFISYLEVANSYNVQGDMLTIGFSSNNGTMIFAAAP